MKSSFGQFIFKYCACKGGCIPKGDMKSKFSKWQKHYIGKKKKKKILGPPANISHGKSRNEKVLHSKQLTTKIK